MSFDIVADNKTRTFGARISINKLNFKNFTQLDNVPNRVFKTVRSGEMVTDCGKEYRVIVYKIDGAFAFDEKAVSFLVPDFLKEKFGYNESEAAEFCWKALDLCIFGFSQELPQPK